MAVKTPNKIDGAEDAQTASYKQEIVRLNDYIADLEQDYTHMLNKLAEPDMIQGVAIDEITRNAIIKALLPQVSIDYPRSHTQKLLIAVDEIANVLGVK